MRRATLATITLVAAAAAPHAPLAQAGEPASPAPDRASATGLRFEQVFDVAGEPATLHLRADYAARGGAHRLELWRSGPRLKRRTDDAVEMHVAETPGGEGYRMVVLDLRRRIATRVGSDDLARIGSFTSWYDLAHGLRRPAGPYRLAAASAPAGAPAPIAPCDWYTLEEPGRVTTVCWSPADRVPLLMLDGAATAPVAWRVTALDHGPLPAGVFELHDEGFVHADAGADITGD